MPFLGKDASMCAFGTPKAGAERPHPRTAGFSGCARALFLSFFLIGTLCVASISAKAQGETTSAIIGQVTDATGGAIPGAAVTITNRETGLSARSRRTRKAGSISRNCRRALTPLRWKRRVLRNSGTTMWFPVWAKSRPSISRSSWLNRSRPSEVSGEAPLINPGNANTSTTLAAQRWRICRIRAAI